MALMEADSTQLGSVKQRPLAAIITHVQSAAARERSNFSVWVPVCLTVGIWAYFSLPDEPRTTFCALLGAVAIFIGARFRHHTLLLVVALALLGFAGAKLRTEMVRTPMIAGYTENVALKGHIADIVHLGKNRSIIIVELTSALGLPRTETPKRVRLTSKRLNNIKIGDHIQTVATLTPVSRPVAPGAFDYARHLYYQSIGGMGRALEPVVKDTTPPPLKFWLRRFFHDTRDVIGARIRAVVPDPLGAFAEAIITGERASIPKAMNESLQASGLFHVLSISGLHMSLVAGGVFFLVRAILALWPHLALNHPIKKWSAAAAMLIGLFYMLLADGGPATERSYIMIAVMFLAVLVDRRAISLHNLSIAAIIILCLTPEQALSAGFQMSFMAVMGIAAFYEWWSNRPEPRRFSQPSLVRHYANKTASVAFAAIVTSLLAGTLSSIPALHHFGRVAPFSVIANAVAMPVISFVIMPMALVGTLALPFGLESAPYRVMEFGLSTLMQISDWIAGWKYAGTNLPLFTSATAATLAMACAVLCLSKSSFRIVSVPLLAGAAVLAASNRYPDIYIEERARNVAIRTDMGELSPARPKQTRFAIKQWLTRNGLAAPTRDSAWTCTESFCEASTKGKTVVFLLRASENTRTCPVADIIVAEFPLRRRCRGKLETIDRFDVWREGAIALTLKHQTVIKTSAASGQGRRPWAFQPRAQIRKTPTPSL